jgi:hypothetical protein
MNAEKYTYKVIWSEEDKEFVGLCTEFPSLSWLDKNQASALTGINSLVKDALKDMKKDKDETPGRFHLN